MIYYLDVNTAEKGVKMSYNKTIELDNIMYGYNTYNGVLEQIDEIYIEYFFDGDELVLESWSAHKKGDDDEILVPDAKDSDTLQTLAEEALIIEWQEDSGQYFQNRSEAMEDYY